MVQAQYTEGDRKSQRPEIIKVFRFELPSRGAKTSPECKKEEYGESVATLDKSHTKVSGINDARIVQRAKKDYLHEKQQVLHPESFYSHKLSDGESDSTHGTMTTYKDSGVDIDEGDELVRRIRKPVRSTFDKNVLADIGLFGSFYRANFKGYKQPVLISSVDGVGTKLKIAVEMNRYDTVGQDLVNHCVNDILVCGARPLYFMDYYATGKLSIDAAEQVILGFVKACKENRCSLVGGETAEMPGMYAEKDFDVAGMIVGVVDRSKIIEGKNIKKGDVLVGIPSSGLHTNGYSLARRVLQSEFSLSDHFAELGCTIGESLLKVHRSYLSCVGPLLSRFKVKGMSHITGGGIEGNTVRIIPKGLGLKIDWESWPRPPVFRLIQKAGDVPEKDMRRTFNLGIGLILVVASRDADAVVNSLRKMKERPVVMGEIVKS